MAKAVIRHDPPGPYKNIYGGWGAGRGERAQRSHNSKHELHLAHVVTFLLLLCDLSSGPIFDSQFHFSNNIT